MEEEDLVLLEFRKDNFLSYMFVKADNLGTENKIKECIEFLKSKTSIEFECVWEYQVELFSVDSLKELCIDIENLVYYDHYVSKNEILESIDRFIEISSKKSPNNMRCRDNTFVNLYFTVISKIGSWFILLLPNVKKYSNTDLGYDMYLENERFNVMEK